MPRYMVERTFPDGLHIPIDEIGVKACNSVVDLNGQQAVTWVHSYVSEDKTKTYCVYDGPNPEAIRRAAQQNPPILTIDSAPRHRRSPIIVAEPGRYITTKSGRQQTAPATPTPLVVQPSVRAAVEPEPLRTAALLRAPRVDLEAKHGGHVRRLEPRGQLQTELASRTPCLSHIARPPGVGGRAPVAVASCQAVSSLPTGGPIVEASGPKRSS
jgi:hypothetical protein